MSDPSRLREMEGADRVAKLLAEGVEDLDRPWSAQSRAEVGIQLAARLDKASRPRAAKWVFVPGLAVAAAAALLSLKPGARGDGGPRNISLGDEGKLLVSSDGAVDLPASTGATAARRVVLKSGKVCAEVAHRDVARQGPLIVEAPHLRVVVVGTHFCVTTADGKSSLSVTEGRVRAEGVSGGGLPVGAGESIQSDDPRLSTPIVPAIAPALVPATVAQPLPATPACQGTTSIEARRACYRRVAAGRDVAAQNALFGLGLLERDEAHDGIAALGAWRLYEERFPGGVFAPEASLAALGQLLEDRRYPEALAEANRYPGNESRVQLVRAQLLMGPLGRPEEALPLLQHLEASDASMREEALYTLGLCQQTLGRSEDAAGTFQRSLALFPSGKHASDIRALLSQK